MSNPAKEFREQNPGATVVKRERNSIHVQLPDGRVRALIASGPIHTESGEEISTGWIDGVAPWQFQMLRADYNAFALSDFSNGQIVRYLDPASGADMRFQPQQLQWTNNSAQVEAIADVASVIADVDDDTLRWDGAFGAGRDFEWIASTDKLSKRLILASAPPDPPQFIIDGGQPVMRLQFIFALASGVEAHIDGAEWDRRTTESTRAVVEFRSTATGDVLWQMQPATADDANGETVTCLTRFRRAGNSLFVEVRVPYEWLQTAAYPVQIDPTLSLQPDAAAGIDNTIRSGNPDSSLSTYPQFLVRSSPQANGLLKFDVSSIPSDSIIDSATLHLWNAESAGGGIVTLNSILIANDGWVEASTWNYANPTTQRWAGDTGNDGGADAGCSVAGTDFDATELGSFEANNTLSHEYQVSLDVSQVQNWLGGNNYGILIRGSIFNGRTSDNTTAAERPKLVIEYTEPQPVSVNAAPINIAVTIPTATVAVPNVVAAQPISIAVTIPQATIAIAPLIQAQPITIAVTIPSVTVSGGVAFGDTVLADKAVYTVVLSDRNQPTG